MLDKEGLYMLQERVNELQSAILDIVEDKVNVIGFTREEMLHLYLQSANGCYSSKEVYNYRDLEFHNINSNALFIIRNNGREIGKYQYKPLLKKRIQFKEVKDNIEKQSSLTFTIRKSIYSNHFHFLTEKTSLLFENRSELDKYLLEKFNFNCSY